MDETLIHCVDDIEAEEPDVIIPIDFPDEDETVNVSHLFLVNKFQIIGWHQYSSIPL